MKAEDNRSLADKLGVTSIVLAGGRGKRFGSDKLSEIVGEGTLLQRVVNSVGQLSSEILVVIAQGQPKPSLSSTLAEVIVDLYPGKSALGGIYTGLMASHSFHSLVVAADMPFLNTSLLRYMVESAQGLDVVVPRMDGNLEPLHAIYSKSCVAPMRRQIELGELRIRSLLDQVSVGYVGKDEIERFDAGHLSFFNVNTPADLKWARQVLEQSGLFKG